MRSTANDLSMKPRYTVDLSRQQADHEANYRCLLRLTPGLPGSDGCEHWQYIIGGDQISDSHCVIEVQERTKYTTTVCLRQHYQQGLSIGGGLETLETKGATENNIVNGNVVKIRLYHDVNLAEVLSWQHYSRFQPRYNYPNPDMHQCDEKARVNSFLGELLTHCLRHGRVANTILPATMSESIESAP